MITAIEKISKHQRIHHEIQREVKQKYKLTVNEFIINLLILKHLEEQSMMFKDFQEICQKETGMSNYTIYGAVKKLKKEGYVSKMRIKNDERFVILYLSEENKEKLAPLKDKRNLEILKEVNLYIN